MSDSNAGQWVLDPAGSTVGFSGKTFWGAGSVRGTFGTVSGSGSVGEDGAISGELVIDAASLNSGNKKRDDHLRSKDFFDVEKNPAITVAVTSAKLDGSELACTGTLTAAGTTTPVTFTAQVVTADADAVVLTAQLPMARSKFGMTWNMAGMVKDAAEGTVKARFVRP